MIELPKFVLGTIFCGQSPSPFLGHKQSYASVVVPYLGSSPSSSLIEVELWNMWLERRDLDPTDSILSSAYVRLQLYNNSDYKYGGLRFVIEAAER